MTRSVCLVIPARNAAKSLPRCLAAARRILDQGLLHRIIVVDDGSTDDTGSVAEQHGASCLRSPPRGRSAARNLGWREAAEEIIWFMDADCVPRDDTLSALLPPFDDPTVAGVGGSFTMPDSGPLLARLIHQEIIQRHLAMPERTNFVATGNAAYRRDVLEQVGGFDEGFLRAQDAELSYRVRAAGYALAFARASTVEHAHDTRLRPYLRAQAQQGYWRFWLHLRHAAPATGDAYSSILDNGQPPLAMLGLASLPLLAIPHGWLAPIGLGTVLCVATIPMTARIVARTRRLRYLAYAPMTLVRAFARGLGLTWALCRYIPARLRGRGKLPPQMPST